MSGMNRLRIRRRGWFVAQVAAVIFVVGAVGVSARAEPPLSPSQAAFLKAELKRSEDTFVAELSRITGLPEAKVRKARPAKGRIVDPLARTMSALERELAQPLNDEQKAAIIAAEAVRKQTVEQAQAEAPKR